MPKKKKKRVFSPRRETARKATLRSAAAAEKDEGNDSSVREHPSQILAPRRQLEFSADTSSSDPMPTTSSADTPQSASDSEVVHETEIVHEPEPEVDFSIGLMNEHCPHCGALRFPSEGLNCCHNGKVSLPSLSPYPDGMETLLCGNGPQSKDFREHIRRYNSAMAFASFGATISMPPGRGPYTFRIHGQIYHRSGSLYPLSGFNPLFNQLYIIEGFRATQQRQHQFSDVKLRKDTLDYLHGMLQLRSPYAHAYRHMKEVEEVSTGTDAEPAEVTMFFKRGSDQRRYNEPTHDEVAAVFVGEGGLPPETRDIVVHPRGQPPTQISHLSANIDPMVYPIFFPRGDLGWQCGTPHQSQYATAKRNKLTLLQFYSYRLAYRSAFSPLFWGEKLFQQYIVDAYVRTEASRLFYLRTNQTKLRVEMYQGLMDHINARCEISDAQPGKIFILPATYPGSPRSMQQHYQDAMAIVAKYGKPDVFLTYTCNPRHPDIVKNLPPGHRAEHRPDIVDRVFHLHLKQLLEDVVNRQVLGPVVAHVYVIEFQKRGLPHCHLLINFSKEGKIRTPPDVDKIISAQIPDPRTDPKLFQIVKSCMVHGPCGILNRNCVCMSEEGLCTKKYPKSFQEITTLNADGYPNYARPDNGITIQVGRYEVDNRWIVPFSPYLSRKYAAHINVEACTTIRSVKYLFKYIYKGHDCATMEMNATDGNSNQVIDHDEIRSFIDARYVSPPEAFWRLSEFHMHHQSHSVTRLPIHLPDQQLVYFVEGSHESALQNASFRHTMLTAFFQLNEDGANLLYTEVPSKYVWGASARKWKDRQRGGYKVISRMYHVSPNKIELYCLRLLLMTIRGPKSYDDLKTVDGVKCNTFKEACQLLQLLENDDECDRALSEAETFQMPKQLRTLFATLCVQCQITDPLTLWQKHKLTLIEDFSRNVPVMIAEQMALAEIRETVESNGGNYLNLDLPLPSEPYLNQGYSTSTPAVDPTVLAEMIRNLNSEQSDFFEMILDHLRMPRSSQCNLYFLEGPGGSGKTYLYNTILTYCIANSYGAAASAWTGIAATLLINGRTAHNLFKFPVPVVDGSTCNVSPSSRHGRYLRELDLLIIDEASMIPKHALQALDVLLRDLCSNQAPFGGKIIILGGDFKQVLPITPRQGRTGIVENCIKSSSLWRHVKMYKLTMNMRAHNDQLFSTWLLELGNGRLPSVSSDFAETISIPESIHMLSQHENIVDAVFGSFTADLTSAVILTPTNESSLEINNEVINVLPGEARTYYSADTVLPTEDTVVDDAYPIEYLHSITPSGMPPHVLILKQGGVIMLLRNLDIKRGLCNGTRLKICHLYNHVLDAELLTGAQQGERVFIPRIKLAPSDTSLPFTLQRVQFPIRLAYSMTINKSQGQTFKNIGIYLDKPVFSHGQLYVAFSRARSFKDIIVQMIPAPPLQGTSFTQNIVYSEIL